MALNYQARQFIFHRIAFPMQIFSHVIDPHVCFYLISLAGTGHMNDDEYGKCGKNVSIKHMYECLYFYYMNL